MNRYVALFGWAYLIWVLLTWTLTLEQQLVGVGVALLVAAAMWPLGQVPGPWRLLEPRRLLGLLRLLGEGLWRVVGANVSLARRIWAPSRPLSSGMVIVPTAQRTDAGLAVTGSITSLVVDNQIVDLDRKRHELAYHAVRVPHGNRQHPEDDINAPIERLLPPILGRS
jgi:multicomponent Na+:H+ antiporter subunit E